MDQRASLASALEFFYGNMTLARIRAERRENGSSKTSTLLARAEACHTQLIEGATGLTRGKAPRPEEVGAAEELLWKL